MLWHQLACKLQDPDADFLLQLVGGVRLGVNETLTPSPAWPSSTASIDEPVPLLTCDSAWKSALDHPDVVASLVQDEIDAGFIVEVADGLEALQRQFPRVAFGKLGVVITEGRARRLVVDSSISNVTANTVLPNHMLLPRIADVQMECAPTSMDLEKWFNSPWTSPRRAGAS